MIVNGVNVKGEWDLIPKYRIFKYRGYTCKIVKSDLGHLCGYIRIPKSLYKVANLYDLESCIRVHGGITYMSGNVIGFDCAHSNDYVPTSYYSMDVMSDIIHSFIMHIEYRNSDYVINELKGIVNQMISKYKAHTSK